MHQGSVLILFIAIVFPFNQARGQDINPNFRMSDNNHALRIDSSDASFFRIIKEMPLDSMGNYSVSLGMDIREQLRIYHHADFGDVPSDVSDNDVFLMQRYMLHADLKLGGIFRIFGQLNSSHVDGKNVVGHSDRDQLGIIQAFLDINVPSADPVRIRLGRQEISFGSERFMGTRDGPNIRQSFDGARLTLSFKKTTGDIFIVSPVVYDYGFFDNTTRYNALVFSGYFNRLIAPHLLIDLFYFGDRRQMAGLTCERVQEFRHTIGSRLTGTLADFYFEAEGEWQTGTSARNNIRAWQLWTTAGFWWQQKLLRPRFQIRGAIMSGDLDSTDRITNTFRPVSPKSPINDIVPVGPANIIVLSSEGEIRLMHDMIFILRYYGIWRYSKEDGIYSTDMQHVIRNPDSGMKNQGLYMARGFAAELNYQVNKHLNVNALGGYYTPGTYVENTGAGKDLTALLVKVTLRF
jgi:hypothetical protein